MKRLCESIWELGHPLFNSYLVRGADRAALVEVGISAVAPRLVGELEALGVVPDLLVVTHPHTDHLSGLGALRERFPGAEVVVGPGAPGFVGHPKAAAGFVAEDRYMAEALASGEDAVAGPALEGPPDLSGAREVGEGARIDLGGLTLELWVAGGHAPGNLVVRVPERGALFVSDCWAFGTAAAGSCPSTSPGTGRTSTPSSGSGPPAPRCWAWGTWAPWPGRPPARRWQRPGTLPRPCGNGCSPTGARTRTWRSGCSSGCTGTSSPATAPRTSGCAWSS
ncbi:MAG: MBL fold metallo-hydrolase [Deltaproteobacteria bacterium]|nr:MBL fold metallo-hydrolase [Deltaproteobacteria bacterium]